VTGLIYKLVELADHEKDYATSNLLQGFVDEQVEEEASANRIVETFRLIGDSAQGLIMLDRDLEQRE
jgi:ferritin